ncbi:hypothetical protein MPTK1_6g16680 [Marchantia polymorpha subsp. ruderalis]|uniref:Uncharacterized protein n=2 Tax=Marchantia polymorpha TaxID=3197 RepID=A0AAF6BSS8_MARPO|nr:hypothetical protein MARPO_0170s0009 [Marchantia polymorpha]BBN15062.1 hypothetical protein Mp_6g16680 [Marchantia polymorpha subsp. ruderalis]|eukprot:PTQ28205.1 hypothetical protein MARPO_0170s0009 [Marchantia polymorpha]
MQCFRQCSALSFDWEGCSLVSSGGVSKGLKAWGSSLRLHDFHFQP